MRNVLYPKVSLGIALEENYQVQNVYGGAAHGLTIRLYCDMRSTMIRRQTITKYLLRVRLNVYSLTTTCLHVVSSTSLEAQ